MMNNLNLKPAILYQLTYIGRFFLIALAIIAAVFVVFRLFFATMITIENETNISINLISIISMMLFIIGIVGIREDIKMFLQHGSGRKTVYFSTLIASLITGVVLGLICELLKILFDAFAYAETGFIAGWLMTSAAFFFAWQLGTLISLIYYRLNTFGIVVFSIVGGAAMIFCIPIIITYISLMYPEIARLPLLLCGILAAGGNFLLIRRAQVKE